MNIDDYNESDIKDSKSIRQFIESLPSQKREMVLTSKGKTVGAIITAEQYDWFLNQLDIQADTSFIKDRSKDRDGSQSLTDLKKELGQ